MIECPRFGQNWTTRDQEPVFAAQPGVHGVGDVPRRVETAAPCGAQGAVPDASKAARRRGQDAAMARCQETRCEGRGRGYGGAQWSDVTIVMVVFVLGPRSGCTYAPSGRTYQKTKTPDACFWTCPTSVVVLLRDKFLQKATFCWRKRNVLF